MKTLKIIGFALKEMFWDTPKWVWMDFKQEYEKAEKSRQEKEFKKNWNLQAENQFVYWDESTFGFELRKPKNPAKKKSLRKIGI